MSLVPVDPSNEVSVITFLENGLAALSQALDKTDIDTIATIKAQAATVETATKQLNLSKESQETATELVRRSEWYLGRAIRRGQDEGRVATHGGRRHGSSPAPQDLSPVTQFATNGELYGRGDTGILNLAEADEDQFDAAIDAARLDGNLSRANVARKVQEAAGKAPRAASRKPLPDSFFDAAYDLTKVTERIDRLVNDDRFPQNAEKVAAKHRVDLLRAVELLSKALDRFS